MNKVAKYITNVGKSIAYSTVDVIKQDNEAAAGLIETNQELFKEIYSSVKNYRTTFQKAQKAVLGSKIYAAADQYKKSLFEDLKTGNWYGDKEREERINAKAMGKMGDMSAFDIEMDDFGSDDSDEINWDDDEFADFDDFEDDDDGIEGEIKRSANKTTEAVIRTGEYVAESNRASNTLLYSQGVQMTNIMNSGFTAMTAEISKISPFVENIDSNSKQFYETATGLLQEQNAMFKEFLEMQRNMYNKELYKEKEEKKKTEYADIVDAYGIPDLKEYGKIIAKNLKNSMGGMGDMLLGDTMGEGSNTLLAFAANPLRTVTEGVAKTLIPTMVKGALQDFTTSLSGAFGAIISQFNYAANESDNPVLKKIGEIFGVRNRLKSSIDTGHYEKGSVPFDGVTRKSIVEVIPGYLRKIESALTGSEERIFDYDRGKWTDALSIRKDYTNIRESSIRSSTNEMRNYTNKYLNTMQFDRYSDRKDLEKDIEKIFKKIYTDGGYFKPNGDVETQFVDYGVNENSMKVFREFWKRIPNYVRMNMAQNVMSTRSSETKRMQSIEDSGSSPYIELANNSTDTRRLDRINNKGFIDTKDKLGSLADNNLVKLLDNKGHNMYYYLQNLLRETSIIRDTVRKTALLGGGGGSGTGARMDSEDVANLLNAPMEDLDSLVTIPIKQTDESKDKKRKQDSLKREEDTFMARQERRVKKAKNPEAAFIKYDPNDESFGKNLSKHLRAREILDQKKREEELQEQDNPAKKWLRDRQEESKRRYEEFNGQDNTDKLDPEKKKNLLDRLIAADSLTAKWDVINHSLTEISRKPADFLTSVIQRADRSLYTLIYGDDTRVGANGKPIKGFLEEMTNRMKLTFTGIDLWVTDNILKPLKDKLGIEELSDIPKKIAEFFGINLEGTGGRIKDKLFGEDGIFGPIITKFNELAEEGMATIKSDLKEVYDPLLEKAFGTEEERAARAAARTMQAGPTYDKPIGPVSIDQIHEQAIQENHDLLQGKVDTILKLHYKPGDRSKSPLTEEEMQRQDEKRKDVLLRKHLSPSDYASYKDSIRVLGEVNAENKVKEREHQSERLDAILKQAVNRVNSGKDIDSKRMDMITDIVSKEPSLGDKLGDLFNTNKETKAFGKNKESQERFIDQFSTPLPDNHPVITGIFPDKDAPKEKPKNMSLKDLIVHTEEWNKAKAEREAKKAAKKKAAEVEKNADGTKFVKRSGLTVISEGESIIPADVNPFNPNRDKANRYKQRKEEDVIKRNFQDTLLTNILGGPIRKNADGDDTIEAEVDKAAKDKEAEVINIDEKEDPLGKQMVDEVKNGAKRVKRHLFGELDDESQSKKVFAGVKDAIKDYAPDVVAHGIMGGGLALLTGLVGGPLVGAAAGAAIGITRKSEKVQEVLFGKMDDKGERTGGVVSKEVQDKVKKYFPEMRKMGIAGAAAGLLTPFGLTGGLAIGAALGWAKKNEYVQNTLFGEDGLITPDTKAKIKKAYPKMAVGTIASLFLGPFGLLGNAVLGAGLGLAASTDTFQNAMFGEPDENGDRTGGILGAIRDNVIEPLKQFGRDFVDNSKKFVQDRIFDPLKRFAEPLAQQGKIFFTSLLDAGKNAINYTVEKFLGYPIETLVNDKLIKPLTGMVSKVFNLAFKPALTLATSPFKFLGTIGDVMKSGQINKGKAGYMTAAERLEFRRDHKGMRKAGRLLHLGRNTDKAYALDMMMNDMDYDTILQMQDAVGNLKDGPDKYYNKQEKQLKRDAFNKVNKFFDDAKVGTFEKYNREKILRAINEGRPEDAEKIVRTGRGTDGKKLSKDDADELSSYLQGYSTDLNLVKDKRTNTKQSRSDLYKELNRKFGVKLKDTDLKYLEQSLKTEAKAKKDIKDEAAPIKDMGDAIIENAKAENQKLIEAITHATDRIMGIKNGTGAEAQTTGQLRAEAERQHNVVKMGNKYIAKQQRETKSISKTFAKLYDQNDISPMKADIKRNPERAKYIAKLASHTKSFNAATAKKILTMNDKEFNRIKTLSFYMVLDDQMIEKVSKLSKVKYNYLLTVAKVAKKNRYKIRTVEEVELLTSDKMNDWQLKKIKDLMNHKVNLSIAEMMSMDDIRYNQWMEHEAKGTHAIAKSKAMRYTIGGYARSNDSAIPEDAKDSTTITEITEEAAEKATDTMAGAVEKAEDIITDAGSTIVGSKEQPSEEDRNKMYMEKMDESNAQAKAKAKAEKRKAKREKLSVLTPDGIKNFFRAQDGGISESNDQASVKTTQKQEERDETQKGILNRLGSLWTGFKGLFNIGDTRKEEKETIGDKIKKWMIGAGGKALTLAGGLTVLGMMPYIDNFLTNKFMPAVRNWWQNDVSPGFKNGIITIAEKIDNVATRLIDFVKDPEGLRYYLGLGAEKLLEHWLGGIDWLLARAIPKAVETFITVIPGVINGLLKGIKGVLDLDVYKLLNGTGHPPKNTKERHKLEYDVTSRPVTIFSDSMKHIVYGSENEGRRTVYYDDDGMIASDYKDIKTKNATLKRDENGDIYKVDLGPDGVITQAQGGQYYITDINGNMRMATREEVGNLMNAHELGYSGGDPLADLNARAYEEIPENVAAVAGSLDPTANNSHAGTLFGQAVTRATLQGKSGKFIDKMAKLKLKNVPSWYGKLAVFGPKVGANVIKGLGLGGEKLASWADNVKFKADQEKMLKTKNVVSEVTEEAAEKASKVVSMDAWKAKKAGEKAAGEVAEAVAKHTGDAVNNSNVKEKLLDKMKKAIDTFRKTKKFDLLVSWLKTLNKLVQGKLNGAIGEKVLKMLYKLAETAAAKAVARGAARLVRVVNAYATPVFIVGDLVEGFRNARTILQVKEVTFADKVLAALLHALVGMLTLGVIPSSSVATWILEGLEHLLGVNLDIMRRREEAANELYEYNQTHEGPDITWEQYLDEEKTGHLVKRKLGEAADTVMEKIGVKDNWDEYKSYREEGEGRISAAIKTTKNAFNFNWQEIGDTVNEKMTNLPKDLAKGMDSLNDQFGSWLGFEDENGKPMSLTEGIKYNWAKKRKKDREQHEKIKENFKSFWSNLGDEVAKFKNDVLKNLKTGIHNLDLAIGGFFGLKDNNGKALGITEASKAHVSAGDVAGSVGSHILDGVKSIPGKAVDAYNKAYNYLFGKGGMGPGPATINQYILPHISQKDTSIASMRFNRPDDKYRQTMGDSGCAPVAASTVINQYANNPHAMDPRKAAKFALAGGYKERDGGTTPNYFTDIFTSTGIQSKQTMDKGEMLDRLGHGDSVVMMGRDIRRSKTSPFGANSHYVVATGFDRKGNIVVQDPNSRKANTTYNPKDMMKYVNRGVIATNAASGCGGGYGTAALTGPLKTNESYIPTNMLFPFDSNLSGPTYKDRIAKEAELIKVKNQVKNSSVMQNITNNLINNSPNVTLSNNEGYDAATTPEMMGIDPTDPNKIVHQNLGSWSAVSAQELNSWIAKHAKPGSKMLGRGATYLSAAQQSGLDPRYLIAHSALETGWGGSAMCKNRANFFGIAAYDTNTSAAYRYADYDAGIIEGAKWISKNYYHGKHQQTTIWKMRHNNGKHEYCTDNKWPAKIADIMKKGPVNTNISYDATSMSSVTGEFDMSSPDSAGQQSAPTLNNVFEKLIMDTMKYQYGSDLVDFVFGSTGTATSTLPGNSEYMSEANFASSSGGTAANEWFLGKPGFSRVTSEYGVMRNINNKGPRLHKGIDYGASAGSTIYSPVAGTVTTNSFEAGGFGNYLVITDANGYKHYFGHMQARSPLSTGTRVQVGQAIGLIGSTGSSTGPHLHYEVRGADNKPVDPNGYLGSQTSGYGVEPFNTRSNFISKSKNYKVVDMSIGKEESSVNRTNQGEGVLEYEEILNRMIDLIMIIANNSNKLNEIVKILNEKLNLNISKEQLEAATKESGRGIENVKKAMNNMRIQRRTPNQTLNSVLGVGDMVDNSDLQYILDSMRAIAVE